MKAKAYIVYRAMCGPELEWSKPNDCLSAEPLYTSPPAQRKPLTDDEIESINVRLAGKRDLARLFARAIEAKLKEKNK